MLHGLQKFPSNLDSLSIKELDINPALANKLALLSSLATLLVRHTEVVSVVAKHGGTQLLTCATQEVYVATTNLAKIWPKTQEAPNPMNSFTYCGNKPCIVTEHVDIGIDNLILNIAEAR